MPGRYTSRKVARKPTRRRVPASAVKKLEKKVRVLEKEAKQVDVKSIDQTQTPITPTWNGTSFSQQPVPQGTGMSNRVGDQVTIVGHDIRWQIVNNAATTTMTRVILILDYENIITSLANVLANTGSVVTPLSPYLRPQRGQYKVLYDKVFLTDAVQKGQVIGKFRWRGGVKQTYNTSTNTQTKNVFKMFFVSDIGVTSMPTADLFWRMFFTDE